MAPCPETVGWLLSAKSPHGVLPWRPDTGVIQPRQQRFATQDKESFADIGEVEEFRVPARNDVRIRNPVHHQVDEFALIGADVDIWLMIRRQLFLVDELLNLRA